MRVLMDKLSFKKMALVDAITNGYPSGNIDKFTAWLDARKWYYEYVR
ncbi:N-acetylmuramoyl-L-alanine amidase C-terminal domain-containing protein [Bacillus cereus]